MSYEFTIPNQIDQQGILIQNYFTPQPELENDAPYKQSKLYQKLMKKDIEVIKRYERTLSPKGFINNIKLLFESNKKSEKRFNELMTTQHALADKQKLNNENIESKL